MSLSVRNTKEEVPPTFTLSRLAERHVITMSNFCSKLHRHIYLKFRARTGDAHVMRFWCGGTERSELGVGVLSEAKWVPHVSVSHVGFLRL
jgi:hypothetical protein